ncbi:MAG: dihydroorotate dehydrogenase electron transfer subunit [Planctomycetia bacterium]|nr:dihydroorotate dehydrogenase electron transfer subunit [Planctomycetia bacterium]
MNTIYHEILPILSNKRIALDTFRLRVESPSIARSVRPGQFVMLRIPGVLAPLLGRPIAIYRVEGDVLDIVYAVVGKGTRLLSGLCAEAKLEIWGPLGNGFPLAPAPVRPLLVGGGIGQTPMFLLAEELLKRPAVRQISLLLGGRDAQHVQHLPEFQELALQNPSRLRLLRATDDGSVGRHGFVTDLLNEEIATLPAPTDAQIYACGPEVMLKSVARLAKDASIPCFVSLETPMACGMGICFTCVTKRKDAAAPEGWDYCRTCVEGPVFDAETLVW